MRWMASEHYHDNKVSEEIRQESCVGVYGAGCGLGVSAMKTILAQFKIAVWAQWINQ